MKRKIITAVVVVAAVTLISGITLLAVASPATNADPLITLSYLNGPFKSLISADIDTAANNINARVAAVEDNISGLDARRTAANVFVIVNIGNGKTLNIPAGCEIMLESGAVSFSGNLVKYSGTPGAATSGKLDQYNMYLASEATVLTASSDSKVWVKNESSTTFRPAGEFEASEFETSR